MKKHHYNEDITLLDDWLELNKEKITIINHNGINILSLDDENFSRPYFKNFYKLLYDYGILYVRRSSMFLNYNLPMIHVYYKIHKTGLAQVIMKNLSLSDNSFDQFVRCEKIKEIIE